MTTTVAPAIADQVVTIVPAHTNNGQPLAPGVVTHLDPKEGTATVHVHGRGYLSGVRVFADKAAAFAFLRTHFQHLPGAVTRVDDEGNATVSQGLNPQTDQPWSLSDVAHWVPAAFPAAASAAPAETVAEAPAAAETVAQKRARLAAELAELGDE